MNRDQAVNLVNQIRMERFPEIRDVPIKVSFVKGESYFMAIKWEFIRYRLYIDASILKFSPLAFIGCLAHELAHISALHSLSFLKRIINSMREATIDEERDTDKLSIKKGYGEALLQFVREHNQDYKAIKKEDGLTAHEIKKLIKKGS